VSDVTPFRIEVPDAELDDLRRRLAATRWPDSVEDAGWDYGTDLDFMRELCAYWAEGYDWRKHESALNALPHFETKIRGQRIHFIHERGRGPNPMPLVVTHGWPSCFYEMHKIIGPLSDPASHGADPADAFDVVVPSLPGYGFSGRPRKRGLSIDIVSDLWATLMETLGYARFGAQGGDWGAAVNSALGHRHPDRLVGLHYNMLAGPIDEASLTDEQRSWWEAVKVYRAKEWGYVALQSTKPQTPSFALNDSPSGLAAWILEKWRRWSDCDGDLLQSYTRDELLTLVTLYWVTQTIGSSMRMYYESFSKALGADAFERIDVPVGAALFNEANRPPRELVEPYWNIVRFSHIERGGHFPAMENPDALVDEVRAFFRPLR
jgi:pimeloyl-ACP methyl ester carboxylesterase